MDHSASTLTLSTPVQYLKGVGPQRAKILERLGLRTAQDVLFFFPRDYVDLSEQAKIQELAEGQPASVLGEVVEVDQKTTQSGKSMVGVLVRQGPEYLRAVWFNQPFMREKFHVGQSVVLSGTPKNRGMRWEIVHPRVTFLETEEKQPGPILPVYRLSEGLRQHQVRRITAHVVESLVDQWPEVFPQEFLQRESLPTIQTALREVHEPTGREGLASARLRLVFQELLVMQLALAIRQKQLVSRQRAPSLSASTKIDSRIRRLFPFELTASQNQVVQEISSDMSQNVPMNRLLQGDVGSGKTAVAAYVMLVTVAHGHQSVLMTPTEVLAQQHFQTLSELLAQSHVRMRLLTGSTTTSARKETLEHLARGEVDILIGTQAIIQKQLDFHRLGLVIIDEQHKFGVVQRAVLRQEELDPHYLVMTATPIPRTVAMTLFGDLNVSALREGPPGRQKINTYLADESQRERWWDFFRRKLREGRQGFVISPLVNDDQETKTSAEAALEHLANGRLSEFRLDLLHGRMSSQEKSDAMDRFQQGETQVLVATSVVEVGIDIANASLMTIEHGERFGLAQLHQLRGRVGRGTHQGYVCVFSSPGNEEASQRLQAFASSTDGFELAETDFQLRGPGEFFGTRQHGLPPLMVADLRRDTEILQHARQVARKMVDEDPGLKDPSLGRLRKMMLNRYGTALQLGDVG